MLDRRTGELSSDRDHGRGDPILEKIHRRFDRLEELITEQELETRRHIDIFAEQFKSELKVLFEK